MEVEASPKAIRASPPMDSTFAANNLMAPSENTNRLALT